MNGPEAGPLWTLVPQPWRGLVSFQEANTIAQLPDRQVVPVARGDGLVSG